MPFQGEIMSIYEQVQEKSLPFIKSYHDDLLKHDKRSIENNPGMPFLHFTGNTGTHLCLMTSAEDYPEKGVSIPYLFGKAERYHILRQFVQIVKCMPNNNRQDLILYFNGKKLIEISQERAESLAWKYEWKILDEWKKTEKAERKKL